MGRKEKEKKEADMGYKQGRQDRGRPGKKESNGRRSRWRWGQMKEERMEKSRESFLHACFSELGEPVTAPMVPT